MTDSLRYPVYTLTESGNYRLAENWVGTLEALAGVKSCELQDLNGRVMGWITGGAQASALTLLAGFEWNGPDVVPDTYSSIGGSMVHDGLRRARSAAKAGGDAEPVSWNQADAAFYEALKAYGDWFLRRLVYWRAVNGPLGRIYAWFTDRFGRKPLVVNSQKMDDGLGASPVWGEITNQKKGHDCWAHAAYNMLEALGLAQGWSPERIHALAEDDELIVVQDDDTVTRGAMVMLAQSLPGVRARAMARWDTDALEAHLTSGNLAVAIACEGPQPRSKAALHDFEARARAVATEGHATVILATRTVGRWFWKRQEFLREDSYGYEPRWYPDWFWKRRNTLMILCSRTPKGRSAERFPRASVGNTGGDAGVVRD